MKLLRSIKGKISKNENGGNVPYTEITEAVLAYSKIANTDYQHDLRELYNK